MTPQTRAVLLSLILLVMLAACGEPAYTPAPDVQATREAEEYQRAADRGQTVWHIGIGVLVIFCAILLVMSAYLANTTYRVKAADAQKAEAEARRLEFISLGDGKAYDTRYKTVIAAAGVASQLPPVMPAEALPPTPRAENKYAEFIHQAAHHHPEKWQGKTIPRFDRMGMASNSEWIAITDILAGEGLIEKSQGSATTITEEQTLGWLYNLLTNAPIDY
jgi:hypothetical protein